MPRFVPPKDAVEALERALEMARDEERWVCGAWLDTEGQSLKFRDLIDEGASDDQLWEEFETCKNVKGCSMTLLILACCDGAALRRYFVDDEMSDIIYENSVLQEATVHLANAHLFLSYTFRREFSRGEYIDAMHYVINKNDESEKYTHYDGFSHNYDQTAHHAKIVQAFERAVGIAKLQPAGT